MPFLPSITKLWDFGAPAASEQRFRSALSAASGDEALILETQIARAIGLRGDFAAARAALAALEGRLVSAGAEARACYSLELGRTYASAAHPSESLTAADRAEARFAYTRAWELAREGGLDGLAVDALHMLAIVETDPAGQIEWNRRALEIVLTSDQPEARRWEASLRNNIGCALHDLGRYEQALDEFELALAARERGGDAGAVRVARWMVAWTLRFLGRLEEAMAIQLRLEAEWAAAGEPDPYVFEELEWIYRAMGDAERTAHYAALRIS